MPRTRYPVKETSTQYSYSYLAKVHGISCLEAREVLKAAGESRKLATYYAMVLSKLERPAKDRPKERAERFASSAKGVTI